VCQAIIVNADDLGISEEVNDASFSRIAEGRITSATIMANGPAARQAVKLALKFPRCSFGVHLNLTQFEPLTGGSSAQQLVDDQGRLSRANERARPTVDLLAAVCEEFCAQIAYLVAHDVRISHLDSHNHVHTRPGFFLALKHAQRRSGIRRVRLTKNFYARDRPCAPGLHWKKHAYNLALQRVYRTQTTDTFTEFLTYYNAETLRKRTAGLIELMVHPGAPDAREETAILDSDWIARADLPVELVPYTRLR
jgi:predicted glycoside hydrolase/deacetylase ChbG (UPF0249 family)